MENIAKGQLVSYMGSYPAFHGPATIVSAYPDLHDKSRDGWRYGLLTQTGEIISLVRRQSFAIVTLP